MKIVEGTDDAEQACASVPEAVMGASLPGARHGDLCQSTHGGLISFAVGRAEPTGAARSGVSGG